MLRVAWIALGALLSALRSRGDLLLEVLALRQQLAAFKVRGKPPHIRAADRAFWVLLRRLWSRWADVLVIVKPDTVVRWHRAGFRLYWNSVSRRGSRRGRPPVDADVRDLIRTSRSAPESGGRRSGERQAAKLPEAVQRRPPLDTQDLPPQPRLLDRQLPLVLVHAPHVERGAVGRPARQRSVPRVGSPGSGRRSGRPGRVAGRVARVGSPGSGRRSGRRACARPGTSRRKDSPSRCPRRRLCLSACGRVRTVGRSANPCGRR